jgi:Mg-chelatase subunit ChlD
MLRPMLSALLLSALIAAPAARSAEQALKVDTSNLPTVRVYLPAPEGAAWTGGTATLNLEAAPPPATLAAFDWAAEQPELAPLPERPLSELSALPVLQLDDQKDPAEGRLVVFLVDASGSMKGKGMAEARTLLEAVVNTLRPVDKVAITRFGDHSEDILPPTPVSEADAIRAAAGKLDVMRRGGGTHLYDALATAVESHVRQLPEPELPGRRFFILFSDGMDGGSAIKVEDFDSAFQRLAYAPAVFTVGVGSGSSSRLKDLERIAFKAGSRDRFLDGPSAAQLVAAFRKANAPLQSQLLVEATLPTWHRTEGSHPARLRLTPAHGAEHTFPVDLAIQKLPAPIADAHASYSSEVQTVVSAHEGHQKTWSMVAWGGGGVGLLVVLLGIGATVQRRQKEAAAAAELAEEERRQAEAAREARLQSQLEAQAEEAKAREARMVARQEDSARRAALASRVPLVEMLCTDGPLKGERFGIFKPRTRVGRDSERCDLVLVAGEKSDLAMSRLHAEFSLQDGGWSVMAMSRGALAVGGSPLVEGDRYPVRLGDNVTLGKSVFLFRGPA